MTSETRHERRQRLLLTAEADRKAATADASAEYSAAVRQILDRCEHELARARRRYRAAVHPAHVAYNVAMARAEREFVCPD